MPRGIRCKIEQGVVDDCASGVVGITPCMRHDQADADMTQDSSTTRLMLRLYVAGQTPRSQRALLNLRRMCDAQQGLAYDLEVIDVMKHPEIATAQQVMATPMLVREGPVPGRRIVGDLTDQDNVFAGLDIKRHPKSPV